ncbi:MAG: SCP2 sterol-binding domain-containing protein [Candidatus Thermoplasmatota archaeon]|nr:SCP2 sterol-binding domain-containing protein [Candidatus Thermoplasmatota archaeon]
MENYDIIEKAIEYLKNNADLKGFDRVVLLKIGEDELCFNVENSDVKRIESEEPDIVIEMSSETFRALANGELSPLRAYALKKVKVKASLKDIMLLKKFLG